MSRREFPPWTKREVTSLFIVANVHNLSEIKKGYIYMFLHVNRAFTFIIIYILHQNYAFSKGKYIVFVHNT